MPVNGSMFNQLLDQFLLNTTAGPLNGLPCISDFVPFMSVQGSEIRYADSTKQVPSRVRQNRQAREGTNFTKPLTLLDGRTSPGKGETAALPRAGHSARFYERASERGTQGGSL